MRTGMHRTYADNRRGFTLVELLVVIGIIAVLIGVLLPALNKARQQSNSLWCLSTLRTFGQAINMYASANNGRLPISYWDGWTAPDKAGTDWAWEILPYLKRGSDGTYAGQDPGKLWDLFHDKDTLDIPGTAAGEHIQTYGIHPILCRFADGPLTPSGVSIHATAKPGPADDGKFPFKLSQIRRASEIILVIDAVQIGDQGVPWSADADVYLIQGQSTQTPFVGLKVPKDLNWCQTNYPQGPDAGDNTDYASYADMRNSAHGIDVRFRHLKNRVANALFCDGHAASFRWTRPGFGGADWAWKNIALDDVRPQDLH
jgi:prepilin-type N-terminal cleavage/methylation domain-containing protein/prepilin-type processing-associated H-X9-DG protein